MTRKFRIPKKKKIKKYTMKDLGKDVVEDIKDMGKDLIEVEKYNGNINSNSQRSNHS